MKQHFQAQALARLRAADPAAREYPDPRAPEARAVLEGVLAAQADQPRDPVVRVRRRALAFGAVGAVGAVVVAAATALAVFEPWQGGEPASAYTVDRHDDGSVAVTILADRLSDPARLNAELARQGARTTVMAMVPGARCPAPPLADPAFELRPGYPVEYGLARDGGVLIVIKPWRIPPGDALVLGYTLKKDTTLVRPWVVTSAPSCLAAPSR